MDTTIEEKVCRLCANRGYNYQCIFDQSTHEIINKIHNCLPVVITPSDKLPAHICKPCLGALDISHHLRNQCLIAESIFKRKLKVVLTRLVKQEEDPPVDDNTTYNKLDSCQVRIKSEKNYEESEEFVDKAEINQIPCYQDESIQNDVFEGTIQIKHENDVNPKDTTVADEDEEKIDIFDEKIKLNNDIIENDVSDEGIRIKEEYDPRNAENTIVPAENVQEINTSNKQIDHHNDSIQNDNSQDAIDIKNENIHASDPEVVTNEQKEEKDNSSNGSPFEKESDIEKHLDLCQEADWICSGCDKAFSSVDDLLDHKHDTETDGQVEVGETTGNCHDVAEQMMTAKTDTKNDMDIEDHSTINGEFFICVMCGSIFDSEDDLLRHEKRNHGPKKHKRTETNESPHSSKKNIEKSSNMENGIIMNESWICEYCNDEFKSSDDLLHHKYKKHNDSDVEMNEDFGEDSLDTEMNGDSDDSEGNNVDESIDIKEEVLPGGGGTSDVKNTCDICKVKILDPKLMELHLKFHEPRSMWCYVCYHTFTSPYDLYIHRINDHKMTKKYEMKWCCEGCEKMISEARTMKKHLKQCKREKYKCKYCNLEFFYKKQLVAHIKKNHYNSICDDPTIERFHCETCERSFIDRKAYTDHTRWHRRIDIRKFTCKFCNKVFIPGHKFRLHMQEYHQKNKTYKCCQCSEVFNDDLSMKIHKAGHHGRFAVKNKRSQQIQETKFSCNECSQCFGSLPVLDRHLRQEHNRHIKWFKLDTNTSSPKPSALENVQNSI